MCLIDGRKSSEKLEFENTLRHIIVCSIMVSQVGDCLIFEMIIHVQCSFSWLRCEKSSSHDEILKLR